MTDSMKPKVVINSLTSNFKNFSLDVSHEFKYKNNNISIGYGGVWLKNPDKLSFRYKLDGLEPEWINSDESKIVNYNNLDPGEYTFMVQVKNEDDVWSDVQKYSFTILTPLWKRWWFWALILITITLLFYSFVRYRIKTLQKENLVLEEKVKERTHQIEQQAHVIAEKNKDITDSISYARKIQHAILPHDDHIKKHLPKSFVVYLTKDIVSGDFYWFNHEDDTSIIMAIDCTGHGVPGAFMSLIGYNILNRIIRERKIINPHEILL